MSLSTPPPAHCSPHPNPQISRMSYVTWQAARTAGNQLTLPQVRSLGGPRVRQRPLKVEEWGRGRQRKTRLRKFHHRDAMRDTRKVARGFGMGGAASQDLRRARGSQWRRRNGLSPGTSGENAAVQTPWLQPGESHLRLLTDGTVRLYICVALSH